MVGKESFCHLVDQVEVAGLQTTGDSAVIRLIFSQKPPIQKRTAGFLVGLVAVSDAQLEGEFFL